MFLCLLNGKCMFVKKNLLRLIVLILMTIPSIIEFIILLVYLTKNPNDSNKCDYYDDDNCRYSSSDEYYNQYRAIVFSIYMILTIIGAC